MKNKIMKAASKLTAMAMVVSMFAMSTPASADEATNRSMTFDRLKAAEATNVTIVFDNPTALGDTDAFVVDFDNNFDLSILTVSDVGLSGDTTGTFALAASCSGDTYDYSVSIDGTTNQTITFTGCADVTDNDEVGAEEVTITTSNNRITNPAAGTYTNSLTGSITGDMDVSIVDDDQVSISGSVDPTLTFDLDVDNSDTEDATPYTVDLGALTSGAVGTSDGSSVPYVWVDISTNATSGATVTVTGDGDGLKSTSTPADIIPYVSGSAALSAGTEGYGICVGAVSETTGATLTRAGNFTSTSCDNSTHTVGEVTSSAGNILTASGPIDGGRAQIWVKAAVASTTAAHPDYTDVITFLASATF